MQLLVVRHAIALDRGAAAGRRLADADRPLTDEGRRRMEKGARALARLVPALGLVATSPLVRARQTADLLTAAYHPKPPQTVTDALVPGASAESVASWLAAAARPPVVAVVGHQPGLGRLVAWLVCGSGCADGGGVRLKKGAACLVELAGDAVSGGGELLWSLSPRLLRELSG